MKIIVDDKIPYIKEAIAQIADTVTYLPGAAFSPEAVHDADALIVRTRTQCNEALLAGSNVQFIATATIGFDHIDTDYCKQAGIVWSNCPGCNAGSVGQYIHSSLLLLQREKNLDLKTATLGIVGVGHVGTEVKKVAEKLGMRVLCCDPPRHDQGEAGFVTLEELAASCDIITFHTPLNREGKYKTYHLANQAFFDALKHKPYLINTPRGEVLDTIALLEPLHTGTGRHAIIAVWEHEPAIH